MWFENHRWEYLESKYLNNDERGIDVVKEDLKLLLLEAMGGNEFAEDRRKPNYQDWIENQVTEAIYNSTMAYMQVYGTGARSSDGIGKPELLQLMEKWRDGIAIIKPKGRTVQLDFSRRGTIASSSSPISTTINVSCKGQEYKTPLKVNQHQVCLLCFDNERAGSGITIVFH